MQFGHQQKPQQPAKFYPANNSLNKNADGFICSINTTQDTIQKSRIESRLEYYRAGKTGQQQSFGFGGGAGLSLGTTPPTTGFGLGAPGGLATSAPTSNPGLGLGGGALGTTFGGGLGGGTLGGGGLGSGGLASGFGGGLTSTFGQGTGLGQASTSLGFSSTGAFGTTAATAPSGGLGFGQLQAGGAPSTSTFGQPPPSTSGGLFGSISQPQQTFGLGQQPQAPAQSIFGAGAQGQFGSQMQGGQQVHQPQFTQAPVTVPQQEYDDTYDREREEEIMNDFKRRIPNFCQSLQDRYESVNLTFNKNGSLDVKFRVPSKAAMPYIQRPAYPNQEQRAATRQEQQRQRRQFQCDSTLGGASQSASSIMGSSNIQRVRNPFAPVSVNFETSPSIEELGTYSTEKLKRVSNFKIFNFHGEIHFLRPVDLTEVKNLDEVINIEQDTIEFYPETCPQSLPPQGQGINVPCKLTFKRFAQNNQKMNQLRLRNKKQFEGKVKLWAEKNNMKVIEIGEDVVVELDSL